MPIKIMGRHHVVVIGVGYAAGIAALPWLPGPYFALESSLVMAAAIAFLIPTAALVTCLSAHVLFRRVESGAAHTASLRAVSSVVFSIALFMGFLHGLVLVSLVGLPISPLSPHRLMVVLTGLLLMGVGNVVPRIRPNIVMGIRARRLLENPTAWAGVHRVAGYCLVALGLITVGAGLTLSKYQIPSVLSAAVVIGVTVNAAAYWRWTRG